MCLCLFIFFFFSSRRRHTRLVSDWSSDVCSSDLNGSRATGDGSTEDNEEGTSRLSPGAPVRRLAIFLVWSSHDRGSRARSEERRVGKECRSRWSREP